MGLKYLFILVYTIYAAVYVQKKLVACNIYGLRLVLCLTERLFDVCEEHKKVRPYFLWPISKAKKSYYNIGGPFQRIEVLLPQNVHDNR